MDAFVACHLFCLGKMRARLGAPLIVGVRGLCSVNADQWICEACGEKKKLFFLRSPIRVIVSAGGLGIVFLVSRYIDDQILRLAVLYIGGVIALIPAGSMLRVRCLICEPGWVGKAWGGQ